MIELKGVTKSFNGRKVIDNLSFCIEDNQIFVILGPSGSGKTTILRLIAGFERPDVGEVWIDGIQVSSPRNMTPPHKRNIGMVFQDLALWPHMKVSENIGFGLDAKGLSKRQRDAKIREALNLVSLTRHTDYYPSLLSGGEQQRVALARALVLEPSILLMDEPLSDLDLQLKEELQKVILALQKRLKITTIYVTHNQDEAASMGGKVAVINNGAIEQIGSLTDLCNRPQTDFIKRFIRPEFIKG